MLTYQDRAPLIPDAGLPELAVREGASRTNEANDLLAMQASARALKKKDASAQHEFEMLAHVSRSAFGRLARMLACGQMFMASKLAAKEDSEASLAKASKKGSGKGKGKKRGNPKRLQQSSPTRRRMIANRTSPRTAMSKAWTLTWSQRNPTRLARRRKQLQRRRVPQRRKQLPMARRRLPQRRKQLPRRGVPQRRKQLPRRRPPQRRRQIRQRRVWPRATSRLL